MNKFDNALVPIGTNEYWVNVYGPDNVIGFRHWTKASIEDLNRVLVTKPLYRIHVRLKCSGS